MSRESQKTWGHQTAVSIPTVEIPPESFFVTLGPWWYLQKQREAAGSRTAMAIGYLSHSYGYNLRTLGAFGLPVLPSISRHRTLYCSDVANWVSFKNEALAMTSG